MAGPNGQPDFGLVLLSYQQAAAAQNSVTNAASFRVRGRSEFSVTCPPYHQPHNTLCTIESINDFQLPDVPPQPQLEIPSFFFLWKIPSFAAEIPRRVVVKSHEIPGAVQFTGLLVTLSGNLLHNYGKSPFLMGKSTINGNFQ